MVNSNINTYISSLETEAVQSAAVGGQFSLQCARPIYYRALQFKSEKAGTILMNCLGE